jgi:hypothetical protein
MFNIGAFSFRNNPSIKDPMSFLMQKYGGRKKRIEEAIISEGISVSAKKLAQSGTMEKEMERLRKEQVKHGPQSLFARNMIAMIEEKLGIGEDDETFEVRFYSSVKDKMLDYVAGIDCWVELYDKKHGKVIFSYKIDLTYDPAYTQNDTNCPNINRKKPFNNCTYFYDPEKIRLDSEGKERIDKSLFSDPNFQFLVESAVGEMAEAISSTRYRISDIRMAA